MPVLQSVPRSKLPLCTSSLIGRDRELETLRYLIGNHRLVTLTGAGGSGKTRLALETLSRLEGTFPDGILWVELASLQEAAFVPHHILVLLGVREEAARSPSDTLLDRLQDQHMLLALDNCEHLVDGCAELADRLLRHCPHLKILTTSREALGITGEKVWLVPLLSLPDEVCQEADLLLASEAVRLFLERAGAVTSAFPLTASNLAAVASICRRLDGIPLAIELAAARANVLAPSQIAERLDQTFTLLQSGKRRALPRHRTLQAAIDWSYRLLTETETVLFRRLSVFPGSFTLEAAERVCSDERLGPDQILDHLSALLDKSLVVTLSGEEARYRMLETVRGFASVKLQEAAEFQSLRDRQLDYFLEISELAAPRIFAGAGDLDQIDRLAREVNNLRAAADWGAAHPSRLEKGLRLAVALHWFWFARGFFGEARGRLSAAEGEAALGVEQSIRAKALAALAYFAFWQGDHLEARPPVEEAIKILREQDDPFWYSYALNGLAMAHTLEGDPVNADPIFEQALSVAQTLGKTVMLPYILYFQGMAAQNRGDYQKAHHCFEEGIRIGRELAHRAAIAHPLSKLAWLLLVQKNYRAAACCFAESLSVHLDIDDRMGMAMGLEGLSRVAAALDQNERAIRLLAGADRLREGIAAPLSPTDRRQQDELVATWRSRAGESIFQNAWNEGESMTLEQLVGQAVDPSHFPAEWIQEAGHSEEACQQVAGSETLAATGLKVVTLGSLQVTLNSYGLACPKKAREMLVFLMCHAQGCSKEQIGLALWPDISPEQLRNVFHVTLSRLRTALGSGQWILSEEKYRFNPQLTAECDAVIFEREVQSALQGLRRGQEQLSRLLQALELYQGPFLQGESWGEWVFEWRDRLSALYQEGLTAAGGHLMKLSRFPEAASVFEKSLAADPVDEGAARQLMVCLSHTGQGAQIPRIYRQLTQALERELDCDPEPETTALFEKLRRQR